MSNIPLTKLQQRKQQSCQETVQTLGEGHYEFQGKYLNQDTYLTFIHLDCQQRFSATLGQFKNGARCPFCQH